MTGRTTSRPSDAQLVAAVKAAMRLKAWAMVDAFVDQHKSVQFSGHVSHSTEAGCANEKSSFDYMPCEDSGRIVTCVLHVGFLSIVETEKELSRLRGEVVRSDNSPARSRMARLLRKDYVRPIDRTAAKVAGGQDGR
jgi:hypothetical protein